MKLDDQRVREIDGVYCYYQGNQRYLLIKRSCQKCGDAYLARNNPSNLQRSKYCSYRCRAASTPGRKREKHHNWKGGRIVDNHGYIRILQHGHPRAKKGYVAEHVLVMEKVLGRYLTDDENIHHKNGMRDDNREENLELWSTSQPQGQRIQDKVSWAKEILKRYAA